MKPGSLAESAPLAFGPYVLDFAESRLTRDGVPLDVPPRPLAVLALLAAHAGRLVTKDALLDEVWGHRHVSESVLKVAINTLRAALGDAAQQPRYIETVPRRGYRFIAEVLAPAASAAAALAGAPGAPPASPLKAQWPGNLPPEAAPLIGRDAEMTALHGLLDRCRLVSLVGPGGVGKTRLALAACRHQPPPDGVWLVRLDALGDAEPLLATVARALPLPVEAGRSIETLAQALEPLRLRLLLDNAEHLADAVAAMLAALLQRAPGLAVLVTSQWPLKLAQEQLLPLTPLPVPQADAGPDAAGPHAAGAIELFIERVRAAEPGFAPGAAERADIAAVCRALDGLPLAIELAAARVALLGVAGVRRRLEEGLGWLGRGPRDTASRQHTLTAALNWTYELLLPAEQRTLNWLSVHAGGFSVESAEATARAATAGQADADALEIVESLRARSLLDGPATQAGTPRLRLFHPVRWYASQRLAEAGETTTAACQHLATLRELFERADRRYLGTPLLEWLEPLRHEADNLRAALRFGFSHAPARDDALHLLVASANFWSRGAYKAEGQNWLDAARPWLEAHPDELLRARYDCALGAMGAFGQRAPAEPALRAVRRASPTLLAGGNMAGAYLCLYHEAQLQLRVAPQEDRRPLVARMRALLQPGWGAVERRYVDLVEALVLRDEGRLQGYHDACVDLVARCRAAGARAEGWNMENALAQALFGLGRLETACLVLRRSVDDMRAAGLLHEYSHVVALAASLRLMQDASADAVALAADALKLLRAEGLAWWIADAWPWLAWWQGRWADAARLQGWADQLVAARGDQRGPVFQLMRTRFAEKLAGHPDAQRLQEAQMAGQSLGEAVALALVFEGSAAGS